MTVANCRSCDAPIEWAVTENRKKIPLDAKPVEDGNLRVTSRVATDRGMTPLVEYVPKGTGDRVSHFATCPDAQEHRR